jgi:hypothetical protein
MVDYMSSDASFGSGKQRLCPSAGIFSMAKTVEIEQNL